MVHNNKPLTLSIIIPAYNEEIHIERCLDSIARQTEAPDEVIVVDNNSTDATAKLARRYKFVTVVTESTQGIYYARNRGFNSSTSEIIARIDADTTLPETWVEQIKQFYADGKNQSSAITGSGYFSNMIFPPASVNGAVLSLIAFRFNRIIMGHYIVWGSNMAILRTQWQAVKKEVCPNNNIHEDLDLAIHLHRNNIKIVYDPSLRVGVIMRRVMNNWKSLWANLMLWPETLKVHGNERWIFGLIGAYMLLPASLIVIVLNSPWIFIRDKVLIWFRFQKVTE